MESLTRGGRTLIVDSRNRGKGNTRKMNTKELISKAMRELGKRGGKSKSKKKRAATKKSLEKARAARWPNKKVSK